MRNKIFREEFSYFLDKFKSKNNFNLLRFSDGEMFLLQNKEIILKSETIKVQDVVESKDGWYSDNNIPRPDYDQKHFHPIKHSLFRDSLVNSFLYNSSNFYRGISCKCCVGDISWDWQMKNLDGDSDTLTWSNLFLNSNYPLFLKEFYPEIIKRKAYFIGNEQAKTSSLPWVKKHFKVGVDIFSNYQKYIDEVKSFISENNVNNEVFLFSASSLSNVMQYELHKSFPNNTYIDIGTTLSHEFGIPVLRGYIHDTFNNNLNNLQTCTWN